MFIRVSLRDCRLSGVLLPHAVLRDVRLSDCRVDGANLRHLEAERVRLHAVDLRDAELSGARLTATSFYDCDLTRMEISHTTLGGAQLHASRLDDLRGAEYLKDAVIDSGQLLTVARGVLAAAGIVIDDERDSSE
jgi:uncharacterized protein YjbI with pentapeptide repeats